MKRNTLKIIKDFYSKVEKPVYNEKNSACGHWTNGAVKDLEKLIKKLEKRWWLNWL